MSLILKCDHPGCAEQVEAPALEFHSAPGDAYLGCWVPRRASEAEENPTYG